MGYISRCIGDARAYRDTPSGVSYTSRLPYTRYVWDTPRGVSYTLNSFRDSGFQGAKPNVYHLVRKTHATPFRPR